MIDPIFDKLTEKIEKLYIISSHELNSEIDQIKELFRQIQELLNGQNLTDEQKQIFNNLI